MLAAVESLVFVFSIPFTRESIKALRRIGESKLNLNCCIHVKKAGGNHLTVSSRFTYFRLLTAARSFLFHMIDNTAAVLVFVVIKSYLVTLIKGTD